MLPSVDDYVCIFEKKGVEINPLMLGTQYHMSRSYLERKRLCESRKLSEDDRGQYIRRNDWIDPKQSFVCRLLDIQGNTIFDEKGVPVHLNSKSMCDYYHNNPVHNRTTLYGLQEQSKPFRRLDSPPRISFAPLLAIPFIYLLVMYIALGGPSLTEFTYELLNTFTFLVVLPLTAAAIWLNQIEY